jgi:hypothetical protein
MKVVFFQKPKAQILLKKTNTNNAVKERTFYFLLGVNFSPFHFNFSIKN